MPSSFRRSRIVALASVLLCLAAPAGAESPDDTDAAFAALLAMPGVQPREGGWLIPEQAEPAPESEKALIARLRRLKREGANFNAIRHRGTLLAHAIRAGKERTAIWLLRNGADPKHVLFSDGSTAYDLAGQYKRAAVVKVLEGQYGFKPPKPSTAGLGAPASPAAPAGASPWERTVALMAKPLRAPYPSKADQLEWRDISAALSREEFAALFEDGVHLQDLFLLVRDTEGGLEDALSRLPLDLVRRNAQDIADLLAEWSFVTYYDNPKISYTAASLSWPALWSRIDQPLRYGGRPDLAGRIPPTLWPALFASGYSRHDADATGCVLSAVDLGAFKALWPDFQRFFADAREEAPGLVLGQYRLARERSPCAYGSTPADTVAKLAFLREQRVSSPVAGLRLSALDREGDPSLAAMAATFAPPTQAAPRLVEVPPTCELVLNDVWLDALVKGRGVGWGVSPEYVQAIDVPGQRNCGLLVSGDRYPDSSESVDDFFDGPFRMGSTRCGDSPDDGEIWVEAAGRIHRIAKDFDMRGSGVTLRQVLDTQTGKRYLLNAGLRGPQCSQSWQLPDAYEWQAEPPGSTLLPSRDDALIERLLRSQCQETPGQLYLTCRGLATVGEDEDGANADSEEVVAVLRKGMGVSIAKLVDVLGAERRRAYGVAIESHDRARYRALLAAGIPPRWTAAEIRALGTADLPLAEKRRRIALLFANPDQLDRTLSEDRYDLPESLLGWLPAQDWEPVLRVIGRNPDLWREPAQRLRDLAEKAIQFVQPCDIDRAQGFLCGGGIQFD